MTIFHWSALALLTGYVLDLIIGDPPNAPHIVRVIGSLIKWLEKRLRKNISPHKEKARGRLLVFIVSLLSAGTSLGLLFFAYRLFQPFGFVVESLLCFQLLATKSLAVESRKVKQSLEKADIVKARKDVSMIVGRDTSSLDEAAVVRATVETVAENTADGIVAPLFYLMLGGAPLGLVYKAVNTMDSMLGYKNERYLHFGRAAAKLDDVFNYIPARLGALIMLLASSFQRLDTSRAFTVWKRDRRSHESPNSAQTESVVAGALGIRLGGPSRYSGRIVDKPTIGDSVRKAVPEDIETTIRLMYVTSFFMIFLALLNRLIWLVICHG